MDFSASSVAKPTKHQMALNIKNGFQPCFGAQPSTLLLGMAKKNRVYLNLIVKQDNI
jgi:hypothetical protein